MLLAVDLAKWLFHRFTNKATPTRPNRFRPTLESLDVRVVPAVFDWTGAVSTDAGNPLNWDSTAGPGALPGNGDELSFGLQAPPPGSPPPPPVDCNNLSLPSTDSFAAIHILEGYAATITFATAITTAAFDMADGAVSQPSSGRDLTVTGSLTWTGGTLNSSGNLATVIITGNTATALIAPTNGGTVNLGSSINLSNGAVATMREGTINVTNDGMEINITANCGLLVDPGEGKEDVVTSPGLVLGPKINLDQGTWMEVRSGKYSNGKEGQVLNNGGKLTLRAGTEAYFEGVVNGYAQNSGDLILWHGSKLRSAKDIKISTGRLVTVGETGDSGIATIECQTLLILGGEILLARDPADFGTHLSSTFGTLKVEGGVDWQGGTYRPAVRSEAPDNGVADLWWAIGQFKVGTANASPTLAPFALDDENNVVTPDAGGRWLVLQSDAQIVPGNNNVPNLNATAWQLDPVGDPVKEWHVISK